MDYPNTSKCITSIAEAFSVVRSLGHNPTDPKIKSDLDILFFYFFFFFFNEKRLIKIKQLNAVLIEN